MSAQSKCTLPLPVASQTCISRNTPTRSRGSASHTSMARRMDSDARVMALTRSSHASPRGGSGSLASTKATRRPALASAHASVAPTRPEPATATS